MGSGHIIKHFFHVVGLLAAAFVRVHTLELRIKGLKCLQGRFSIAEDFGFMKGL